VFRAIVPPQSPLASYDGADSLRFRVETVSYIRTSLTSTRRDGSFDSFDVFVLEGMEIALETLISEYNKD
jgi:hypothetical protein